MNVFYTSLGQTLPLHRAVHIRVTVFFAHIRVTVCLAHSRTLQHTATHCNTLQYTATHRNTSQRTAQRVKVSKGDTASSMWGCTYTRHNVCGTLQHTAAHYNTLQHIHNILSTTPLYTYMLQRVMQHTATQVSLFCHA